MVLSYHPFSGRVYLEKKKARRQQQARFAKKQAEVGKWKHLVVSPSTDSRWAQDSYFYPIDERDYTHEEVRSLLACNDSLRRLGG